MGYSLGIDVGTTFTAAAIWRDERVEVVSLESHRVAIPSVIFAAGDEIVFGTTAVSRGSTDPTGAAREFKRRLGDAVPLVLSGAPYSADRLVALFADWVVRSVSEQFGEPPERVVVTHPANWTEFQLHLLTNALNQVGLGDAAHLTEPQAAAIDFGAAAHLEPGELVVVYDLGGGTFDVAVLRREHVGFAHVGEPAGVERLGGIDFDEAVFQHVMSNVPESVVSAARSDPAGRMALAQLRRSCIEAKESLSNEVAVDVPVVLPGATSTVRLTRSEFEGMIRPMLNQTVDLVQQVIARNEIAAADLAAVLLVGGSSRIPVVSELVREQIGAPVRVDAHPKLVVSRGAARWAGTLPRQAARAAERRSATTRRRTALIAAGVASVAAIGAGAWFLTAGGDDGGAAPSSTDPGPSRTTQGSAPQTAETTDTATSPPATIPSVRTLPAGERVLDIEPIGQAEIPGETTVDGHLVGGLTGLTTDPQTGMLLALSDARTGARQAVTFELSVDLSDGQLEHGDVTVEGVTQLRDDERAYGQAVDLEGIVATSPETVLVVSEGSSTDERIPQPVLPPAIHEFDRSGEFVREWQMPEWYLPDPDRATGLRPEGGLQSITVTTGDSPQVLAAMEYTLYQDEATTDYTSEKSARILAYDMDSREPVAEYRYPLDPTSFDSNEVFGTPFPSGLLDILALGEGRSLVAVERSLIEEPHTWRLFEVTLDPRTAATPAAEGPRSLVTKRLLDIIDVRANFESVAFGPVLPDGRRSLILVDDNLFATDDDGSPRGTTVVAYAIETGP
jgi:actin-like ATPase involved in cell morphogenesis